MKSTLVVYRKGLCGFFLVLGFALEEKLRGTKCCKYYGPEGVLARSSGRKVERHEYQMIPHGQEQETMRKQHETTIHRDMQPRMMVASG